MTADHRSHVVRFAPPEPRATTPRGEEVAALFGLNDPKRRSRESAAATPARRPRLDLPLPVPGELWLLSGPSGSGKSSLLRAMRRRANRANGAKPATTVIDLRHLSLPERPVVELFGNESLETTLRRLSRVGLAEVWTWLRPPFQLSEGQRWRLRLALALAEVEHSSSPTLVVCDEFAAVLDRVTACVVAAVLRRAVTEHAARLSAVVATSHGDLSAALAPDVTATCDFGEVALKWTRGAR